MGIPTNIDTGGATMNRVSMRPAMGRWSALVSGAALVSILAILPQDALGGDCVNYADYIHLVGSVHPHTPRRAFGVAVAGNRAYVTTPACFPYGDGSSLEVVDISNPASPAIIGSVETPGFGQDVAVAATHAYIAGGNSGLQVVDISNPASPAIVGSVDTPGEAADVAVLGDHAYVA